MSTGSKSSTIQTKAIIFDTDKPRQFEVRQFEIPARARKGEALVRTRLAGVCGSDIHTFHGKASYGVVIPGHEMVGEILSVDEGFLDANGDPLHVGDRVVPESTLPCLRCSYCRGVGSRHDKLIDYGMCEDYQLWGAIPLSDPVWMNGAYAQYLQVPQGGLLHRIGDGIIDDEAILLEPMSVGVKAAFKAGITVGDTVVVEGPGPIGMTCAMAARECGASQVIITGVRGDESRLALAMELGATATINVMDEDAMEKLADLTGGHRADRVIDTTGALPAFDLGLRMTARGGVYTCIGGYPKGTTLPVPQEYCLRNKIDIRFSHLGTNSYQPAYRIIESHRYPIHKMVTHRWPLEEAQAALEDLSRREGGHVKVVLEC